MKLTDLNNVEKSTVDYGLEVQMDNFRHCDNEVGRGSRKFKYTHCRKQFEILITVHVFSSGIGGKSEDSLRVLPTINIRNNKLLSKYFSVLTCILSIMDVEGNSRLPRSFQHLRTGETLDEMEYLERTLILKKADEFLPNDVLTIRCDFYFNFNEVEFSKIPMKPEASVWKFLKEIPHTFCNHEHFNIVFDFTLQILTLPRFHELRRRFDVYGIPPVSPSFNYDYRVDSENIWMFDTEDVRFLLILDESHDSFGGKLLKASPAIRRSVNAILSAKREKRIHLPNISSRTFIGILYFLDKSEFCFYKYSDLSNIQKMCHLYEMEDAKERCSKDMHDFKHFWEFDKEDEKEETSDLGSEEYLSKVWDSRRHDREILMRFLISIPQTHVVRRKYEAEIENPNDITTGHLREVFTVYDFTGQVLILPQFHEMRKRFGVYGIPPLSASPGSENNLEHVWIFDTCPDRFLVSVDGDQNSIGARLLQMSSVIRMCANAPAKERNDRLIDFSPSSSWSFLNVLYFAEYGILRCSEFSEYLDIYKIAHLYQIIKLQKICAEEMVKSLHYLKEFEEVEEVIDFYADKNLKSLFDSRRRDYIFPDKRLSPISQAYCNTVKFISEETNSVPMASSSENFTVYDFTSQIPTLPQFHDTRKRFGVYGIPPSSECPSSEQKADILKEVWIFDTCPDRFILFIDTLGLYENDFRSYILRGYFVIRRISEYRDHKGLERRVFLSNTSSRTFRNFLYYVETESFSNLDFCDILDMYKMSYFYDMRNLKEKSTEEMVMRCKSPTEFETLKRLADIYLDDYLRMLLDSSQDITESSIMQQLTAGGRPYFEFYG